MIYDGAAKQPYLPTLQIQKLIRNAIICLGSFLFVAITAAPSFNAFTAQNAPNLAQGVIAYVPLSLGISFLIALLASSLALIVLLVCQQLKADLKTQQKNSEKNLPCTTIYKNIKRLS